MDDAPLGRAAEILRRESRVFSVREFCWEDVVGPDPLFAVHWPLL